MPHFSIVSSRPRRRLALPALAALTLAAETASADFSVDGSATLATDFPVRGVSQTMSSPALQGCVEFAHESGFSGYVWGSNVDFVAEGDPDDGARLEFDVALGYEAALSERIGASVHRVQYMFPGINPGLHYDYGEWIGELILDERHRLTLGYSDDINGLGERGRYVAVASALNLPAGVTIDLQVGHNDLEAAYGESYNHAALSVSGSIDRFTWRLAYHVTDRRARDIFYESAVEPRMVLSVSVAAW
jgi:uncharacterized protein (TIGR02001 family)